MTITSLTGTSPSLFLIELDSPLSSSCHDRDLKPQNLLLTSEATDAEVVVVDFGFAKKCDEDCLKTYCGTLDYMAPEILRCSKAPYGQPHPLPLYMPRPLPLSSSPSDLLGKAVDMWSFGVILYILLGGYSPFTGSKKSIMTNIATGQFEFHSEYWLQVSHSAQDLIKRMLQVDPKKRFTANQALGHEWLKKTDEELDQHQLSKGLQELRKHLIKRKLRAALRVVVATGRLRRGLLSRQSSAMIRIEDLNLDDM
jgi:calcium/calmodulin-dependent protein kinase I